MSHKILHYELVEEIGRGGFGSIHSGVNIRNGHRVAVKLLHQHIATDPVTLERFKLEAQTLARMEHDNVVDILDYFESPRSPRTGLVMEYIDGINLQDFIKQFDEPIPEIKIIEIFNQILDGLHYAHKKDIVHRDIKPANILLTSDNLVKIVDFGIAKITKNIGQTFNDEGKAIGTMLYMSPEQIRAIDIDHRADIYSLGLLLHQMYTRQMPYATTTTREELKHQILNEKLPDPEMFNPFISNRTKDAIYKATEKQARDRFKNCKDFKKSLYDKKTIIRKMTGKNTQIQRIDIKQQFEIAPGWARLVAQLIDLSIYSLLIFVNVFVSLLLYEFNYGNDIQTFVFASGVTISLWIYHILFETNFSYGTIGKMALGLKLINNENKPISIGQATGRMIGKLLSLVLFGIGFFMIGFSKEKAAMHDLITDTKVIRK